MVKEFFFSLNFLKKYGIKNFVYRVVNYLFKIPDPISLKKKKILDYLISKSDLKVLYGPFKNMLLMKNARWAKFDLIPQLLGTYEENIVNYIINKREINKELFVEIGAGDGYFVVGFSFSEMFNNIYAFEISDEGRKIIKNNAIRNNCLNKLKIIKEANYASLLEIERKFSGGIILIDIEGAEYDLLNEKILSLLSQFHLVVEMHPFLVANSKEKHNQLISKVEKYFLVEKSIRENYNPSRFKELSKFTEDEQLLALSEGRSERTEWLLLSPKN